MTTNFVVNVTRYGYEQARLAPARGIHVTDFAGFGGLALLG
jgi:hypothetical protein